MCRAAPSRRSSATILRGQIAELTARAKEAGLEPG